MDKKIAGQAEKLIKSLDKDFDDFYKGLEPRLKDLFHYTFIKGVQAGRKVSDV